MRPQDFIRCLHKPSGGDSHNEQNGMSGLHVRCLPQRKSSKQCEGKDAVKRLSGDVENLMVTQENKENLQSSESNVDAQNYEQLCKHLSEDVHKHLHIILDLIKDLTGEKHEKQACQRHMPPADAVELLEQLIAADLPVQLLAQIPNLEFETRKDVMNVCCALLWTGMPQQIDKQVLEYLHDHPKVFHLLVAGYAKEEAALHYGVVLRSCARHRELVEAFLGSGEAFELIRYARHPCIDISSDAFYTLREMLLEHKEVAAAWLDANFQEFFGMYNALLTSGEYVAERQAQKLLAEILLDRNFRRVMLAYVNNERHLQIHMNLLKDSSKVIQVEAFHVFKIFVANPQKPHRVQTILYKNREKLVILLESLHSNKPDDKKFGDDQRNVIDKLRHLDAPTSPVRKATSDSGGSSEASTTVSASA
jgi:calcium binding protein 39